jgi:glucose-6-phosphate isomerase
MFRGRRINVTEDRSVLHVALRAPRGRRLEVGHHHDLLMADLFAQSEAPAFGE